MSGFIELAEADREKYGAPERVPLEYGRWGLKSIDALEKQVGLTVEDLGNGLQAKDKEAFAALIWMSLRSIGIRVAWADFDVQYRGLHINFNGDEPEAEDGGEGKAEESEQDPPA